MSPSGSESDSPCTLPGRLTESVSEQTKGSRPHDGVSLVGVSIKIQGQSCSSCPHCL